ncbi:hypothetical protein ACQFYA_13780 [Promicromonospora sp. Marseille-Q5078]
MLALPSFRPGMGGPGAPRVPAMLLVALGPADDAPDSAPDDAPDDAAGSVPGRPVHGFLAEHLVACEGSLADDAATRRLLEAASGDRVPVVDPADPSALRGVPVGTLDGAERYAPAGATGSA